VHRVIDAAFGGRILVREVDVSDNQMGGSIFEKVFDVRAKHHHTARTQKANPNQSYKEKKKTARTQGKEEISVILLLEICWKELPPPSPYSQNDHLISWSMIVRSLLFGPMTRRRIGTAPARIQA